MRRRMRRIAGGLVTLLVLFLVLTAGGCMNPSMPTDLLLNLPGSPHYEELETEGRPLVVLQHGLFRSSGSMWRIERALEAHGYSVLNTSYPSTFDTIEAHAARLGKRLAKHLSKVEGEYDRVYYVGHSMGGLVIRTYLRSEGAIDAASCVFIGTPHRGATLAELDHERWWFRWFLGTKAAKQLCLSDPFHRAGDHVPTKRIGVIFGGKGDGKGWSERIAGDDDGTVGSSEAQIEGQTDSIRLPMKHTRLGFSAQTVRQVLVFLKHGRFDG